MQNIEYAIIKRIKYVPFDPVEKQRNGFWSHFTIFIGPILGLAK